MRKLYSLVAGLLIGLVTMKAVGQDVVNCTADFEVGTTTNSTLTKKFYALPGHSTQKKPVYICWSFGDGKDTCIQYSNTYADPYTVIHTYQHTGVYEVCVRIVYEGGCEAKKCKEVKAEEFCRAGFEKAPLSPTVNPLYATFNAFPWHSANKKPQSICWTFGDGRDTCIEYSEDYSGLYVVRHKYNEPGDYEVCVKIKYYGGCEAYACKHVLIEKPDVCSADFERIPVSTTNDPLHIYLKALPWNNSYKKPKKICWNFGDGRDTCIEYGEDYTGYYVVPHTYREPGNYNVCIKILYYDGCEAGKCKYLQIGQAEECKADFQRIPVENADHPFVIGLKALPWHNNYQKPKLVCWSFGDGQDTCVEYAQDFSGPYTIRHKYLQPGTYEVCVKIFYYGGCEAKICKPVVVEKADECRADFERIEAINIIHPLVTYYKALPWHNNNKKPKVICWRFGDGKDTCIEYPENFTGPYVVRHEYREPGNYEVCIKITYYGGCEAYKCKLIQVGRPDECKADFERIPISSVEHPLAVALKALLWNNNYKKPKLICWSFGDGKDTCIEYGQDYTGPYGVRHEYQERGVYEVCIKILFYGGCEARLCKEIRVGEPECKADFERLPITTDNPLHVGFKALPAHSNNKPPAVICWKFGDGTDTCIQYPENYTGPYVVTHKYNHGGEYEVCVVIKYYGGCEARMCKKIVVQYPQDECRVKLFEITPSISSLMRGFYAVPRHNNNKRPALVCWSFGDGTDTCIQMSSIYPWPNLFIRHTYPGPGVYRTCVKILFQGGCIAYDCKEVVIRPVSNVCGGFITDSLTSPRTFKFKAYPIHNPDDPVAGISWSFGDGSGANGREVTHTYNYPGTYEVCATIKTQRGCVTKICKHLTVPGNAQSALQLTPNPVSSTIYVLFYSTHTESVSIKVVNANGVVVREYIRNAVIGSNNWSFDLSTLTQGMYTLVVQSPNQLSSAIFIKN